MIFPIHRRYLAAVGCLAVLLLGLWAPIAAQQSSKADSIAAGTPPEMPPRLTPESIPVIPEHIRDAFHDKIQKKKDLREAQDLLPFSTQAAALERVAIIVDSPLYAPLQSELAQYVKDIAYECNVDPVLYHDVTWADHDHEYLREYLQQLYASESITGAVLVGFFPYYMWEYPSWEPKFPILLPFMDLENSEFLDTDDNGRYETYNWWEEDGVTELDNRELEIWVSLIRPYQIAQYNYSYTTEVIEQLRSYFVKCNRYYHDSLVIPQQSLLYVHHDWWSETNPYGPVRMSLDNLSGDNPVVVYGGEHVYVDGQSYLDQLINGFEVNNIWSHSSAVYSSFNRGPRLVAWSRNVRDNIGRGSVINVQYNCYGACFSDSVPNNGSGTECLAQIYSFEGNGMVSMGVTRSIGTGGIDLFFDGLASGMYVGQIYHEVMNIVYNIPDENPMDRSEMVGHYIQDQILMGNPFVRAFSGHSASGALVSGQVQWDFGQPASQARVMAYREGAVQATALTGEDGSFAFPPLDRGNYEIVATSFEGASATRSIVIERGQTVSNLLLSISRITAYANGHDKWKAFFADNESELPSNWADPACNDESWKERLLPVTNLPNSDDESYLEKPWSVFRKRFFVDNTDGLTLRISADNGCEIYINGTRRVVSPNLKAWNASVRPDADPWNYHIDISSWCSPGENLVAIKYVDYWCGLWFNASVYQETPLAGTATLSGTVFSAETGLPIENHPVIVRGPITHQVSTNQQGTYSVLSVEGDYTVGTGFVEDLYYPMGLRAEKQVVLETAGATANIFPIHYYSLSTPTYLSGISWQSVSGTVNQNLNAAGGPITGNGMVYEEGLGILAPAEVVCDLGGRYAVFNTDVTFDDQGGSGKIRFEVWGDGVLLHRSREISGTDRVEQIQVSVSGVQTLRLVAIDIPNDRDHPELDYYLGNWANMRLYTVGDDIMVVPQSVDFGSVRLNQTGYQDVFIVNNTDREIPILSFSGSSPSFYHSGSLPTLAPYGDQSTTVSFSPTVLGDDASTLSVVYNFGVTSLYCTGTGYDAIVNYLLRNFRAGPSVQSACGGTTRVIRNLSIGSPVTTSGSLGGGGYTCILR